MKTIKLLTFLLGAILFLNVGSATLNAQDMQNSAETKVPKAKTEAIKNDSEKLGDARLIPKAYNNADWTRKSYNQGYEKGKIKTH